MDRGLFTRISRRASARILLASVVFAACVTLTHPVAAATATQVSLVFHSPTSPSTAAVGVSTGSRVSADGAYVVFESTAANLVPNQSDGNGGTDIFLMSRLTGAVTLVSHTPAGTPTAGNARSRTPVISANGEFVAFTSSATNLIPNQNDGNAQDDVFLFSRSAGAVTLISHRAASITQTGGAGSDSPSISADGGFLAFRSSGLDFDSSPFPKSYVYLYSVASGMLTLASNGGLYDDYSYQATISADGAFVVYLSPQPNVVPGQTDANTGDDVYLFSRATGAITLVSHTPSNGTATGNRGSGLPSISADGAYVAFQSRASDLIVDQNDVNGIGVEDVFLFSRATGVVTLVSHADSGAPTTGNGLSGYPVISADGAFVVFQSASTNLVIFQADYNNAYDVFLFSRATGDLTLVSHGTEYANTTSDGFSGSQSISADGAFVAFSSDGNVASIPQGGNGFYDVFLFRRDTLEVTVVSHASSSAVVEANGVSTYPSISADGAFVAFQSTATNLTAGQSDANGASDVFLYSRVGDEGTYTPLTPARILDTRNGTGGLPGAIGPGATVDVQVTGRGGVPTTGVSAVAMNVTVTQPTGAGYLTMFPSGTTRPLAANLNFTPGKTVPNLVVVKLGAGGKVSMFNSSGSTHVIYDVAGWYSTTTSGNAGRYSALVPARILDTRGGVRLGPGASMDLQVSGRGGVPAAGVSAAVLNVAVTGATAVSFLTVYPTGGTRPEAANLNDVAGDTVSNRVMAKLGTGGKVTLYNNAGSTDVVVDVGGWYSDASVAATTGAYTALAPARVLDTRDGTGGVAGALASNTGVDVQLTGVAGVPATGVTAVILNATVTSPAGPGYLTISPTGTARPLASDLNYATDETRPNLVVVRVGTGGKVNLFTSTGTHVVFDVAGWFS